MQSVVTCPGASCSLLCATLPRWPFGALLCRLISRLSQRTETNARGWYDDELTKQTRDWKEGFDVGHVPRPDLPPDHPSNVVVEGYNQWPDESLPLFKVCDTRTVRGAIGAWVLPMELQHAVFFFEGGGEDCGGDSGIRSAPPGSPRVFALVSTLGIPRSPFERLPCTSRDHDSFFTSFCFSFFPPTPPQETVDAFYSNATRVARHLLEGVAAHLGLPRGHFGPPFEPHTSYLRLNYYPLCPEPSTTLSVNRHTDAGALTVLLQEKGTTALQVR